MGSMDTEECEDKIEHLQHMIQVFKEDKPKKKEEKSKDLPVDANRGQI